MKKDKAMSDGTVAKGNKKKSLALKKLVPYLKKEILFLVLVVVITIVSVGSTIYAVSYLKSLTNYISECASKALSDTGLTMRDVMDMGIVANMCAMLIVLYSASVVCSFFQAYIMAGVNQRVAVRLRADISKKINRLPLKYFDSNQIGDTMSRVTNDVDTIAQSLNSAVSTFVSCVVQLVIVITVMLITNWQMTLTAFISIPLSIVIILTIVKLSQKYFKRQQQSLADVNSTAEETYSGLLVLKAFCAEGQMQKKFSGDNKKLEKAMFRANSLSGLTHPLSSFVSKLGYVALCVVGGILISSKITTIGTLAAFLIYINLFQAALNQLMQIINVFQSAAAASFRVFEFLEESEQANEIGKTKVLDPNQVKGDIEFKNVSFGYDVGKTIINNFSINVKAGQKVAIIGPTGAGKTTLVNLLMRFYEIDGGEILIDGVNINELTRENVRSLFSMVLQDTWLFDGTVKENLIYSKLDTTDEQLVKVAEDANILHYIKSLPNGFDANIGIDESVSSGQKQLLTIARAMIQNAPMMILDEATSNVDTCTEANIQKAMDKLTEGRTSFVIAHRLSTIKNADLILVLKDGDIVESGSHNSLITQNGLYSELYNSQFSVAT